MFSWHQWCCPSYKNSWLSRLNLSISIMTCKILSCKIYLIQDSPCYLINLCTRSTIKILGIKDSYSGESRLVFQIYWLPLKDLYENQKLLSCDVEWQKIQTTILTSWKVFVFWRYWEENCIQVLQRRLRRNSCVLSLFH
jgi:hypothetical protein